MKFGLIFSWHLDPSLLNESGGIQAGNIPRVMHMSAGIIRSIRMVNESTLVH